MNKILRKFLYFLFLISSITCKSPSGNNNTVVSMKTTLGDIKLLLYDDTPIHRDNFIRLINEHIYDGLIFHRVINNFMIQAGDPYTSTSLKPELADSLSTFTIPAEINLNHFHKKGALAAARQGNDINPEMRSSGTQFYIIQGTKHTDNELDQVEQMINNNLKQIFFNRFIMQVADSARILGSMISDAEIQEIASSKMFDYLTTHDNYVIPEDQRIIYKNQGGVPRLDGTYTVFGEVIEGLDVVDRIAIVPTDNRNRPLSDIRILKIKISGK